MPRTDLPESDGGFSGSFLGVFFFLGVGEQETQWNPLPG